MQEYVDSWNVIGTRRRIQKFSMSPLQMDSRARDIHWTMEDWPKRKDLIPGSQNVIHANLVDKQKILLPPLHIKLGIMKQFFKVLYRSGSCLQHLSIKFLILSEAKVKEGIFDGPQIEKLMKDAAFMNSMNNIDCHAWNAFVEVVRSFLGDVKYPRYKEIVENMLEKLRVYGCNISLKLHLLHSHLDHFPGNLGTFS